MATYRICCVSYTCKIKHNNHPNAKCYKCPPKTTSGTDGFNGLRSSHTAFPHVRKNVPVEATHPDLVVLSVGRHFGPYFSLSASPL